MGTTEKLNKGAKKSKVVFHCSVSPFLQISHTILIESQSSRLCLFISLFTGKLIKNIVFPRFCHQIIFIYFIKQRPLH